MGVDKTADILSSARKKNRSSEFIDFVINMVCLKYRLSPEHVINSVDKNNKRIYALRFICFYCYHHGIKGLVIHQQEIADKVIRKQQLVQRYCKEMAEIKKKQESALKKYFDEFDEKIATFK